MGREHVGSWKHIFIYIACLIFALFLGCVTVKNSENRSSDKNMLLTSGKLASVKNSENRSSENNMLLTSQKLMSEGNFEEALKENEKAMSLFTKEPLGDQAIYNMGLIYAHYMNPGKDFNKSLTYFEKLSVEHPQSPLADQAKIWAGLLKEISAGLLKEPSAGSLKEPSAEQEYFDRSSKMLSRGDYQGSLKENRKVLSLYNTAPPADQALFNIGLIYAHYGNPDKDYLESIQYLEKLVQKYPESPLVEQAKIWINVLNIIEKAKQVDIEIEKKKKELTR